MYHDMVVRSRFKEGEENYYAQRNPAPEYEILLRMIDTLEVEVHQSRMHIQKLGQVTPIHIDSQQMRYARPVGVKYGQMQVQIKIIKAKKIPSYVARLGLCMYGNLAILTTPMIQSR